MKFNKVLYSMACLVLVSCHDDMEVRQIPAQPYIETTSYNVQVNDYVPVFDKKPSRTLENVEKFNIETKTVIAPGLDHAINEYLLDLAVDFLRSL